MNSELLKGGIHDLRNQLLEMQLALEFAREQGGAAPEIQGALGKARLLAEFLWEVVEIQGTREVVVLERVIEAVAGRFRESASPLLGERNGVFPAVLSDPLLLEWVFYGIVLQAASHWSREVRIVGKEENGEVTLSFVPTARSLPAGMGKGGVLGSGTLDRLLQEAGGSLVWELGAPSPVVRVRLPAAARVDVADGAAATRGAGQ